MWRPLAVAAAAAAVGFGLVPTVAAAASTPTAVTDDTTVLAPGMAAAGQTFDVTPPHHFQSVAVEWAGPTPGDVTIRALVEGSWTGWTDLDGDPSVGPNPSSPESRPMTFTDTTWVGSDASRLQVRVSSGLLADLRAVTIAVPSHPAVAPANVHAAALAGQPAIIPRSAWGESEQPIVAHPYCTPSGGDPYPAVAAKLQYAVVHHTDTFVSTSPAQSYQEVQAIYTDHVVNNGWCDIGYNFLIDQYGQIFEGRAGGITQAVVGAHAGGYNVGSVGVALLGNFDQQAPTAAAYQALVRLLAWKFQISGVNPLGSVTVNGSSFSGSRYPPGATVTLPTIVGHRDVDYTDCPGQMFYDELPQLRRDVAAALAARGLDLVASDGGIFSYGSARFYGSAGGLRLNQPVVGMAATPTGHGYWLVASDGGIFAYGDAHFYGSTGSLRLNRPVVGMAPTPTGQGYWFVASDGGIFAYGDAHFYGSIGGSPPPTPIVAMAAQSDGQGYALVDAAAQVFGYGSAGYLTQTTALSLNRPIVGVTEVGT